MQNALTILVPVRPGHEPALRLLLEEIGTQIATTPRIRFADLSMIHFARWVLLENAAPDPVTGKTFPTSLAFGTDHDGPDAAMLSALHGQARELLQEIYGHCIDAPTDLAADAGSFIDYMMRHQTATAARHIGYRNHTVENVRNALMVRDAIEMYLDTTTADPPFQPGADPVAAVRAILAHVDATGLTVQPSPRAVNTARLFLYGVPLALLAALLLLVVFRFRAGLTVIFTLAFLLGMAALLFLWWLRRTEAADAKAFQPPTPVIDAHGLDGDENHIVQNQMTHTVPIKPGAFRRLTLRAVLSLIDLLAAAVYDKGELGGIPTIHFARWMIFDHGRSLLFFSNYDGSWESYLGDFVDRAHVGLTVVWSNTVGFPPTHDLIRDGATNVDVFKAWTRQHQAPTQVWYSAYPNNTVTNINNAIAIRDGLAYLHHSVTPESARVWLERLGDCYFAPPMLGSPAPPPAAAPPALEMNDIQGLVLYGYGYLPFARYLLLRIEDAARAKAWLGELTEIVSDARPGASRRDQRAPVAVQIAFTAPGLTALGQTDAVLATFPTEFVAGMASRARILGDNGKSDPAGWEWGGTDDATPHVLLMLFARDASHLTALACREEERWERVGGLSVIQLQDTSRLEEREHFGFRDGISNPAIQGAPTPPSAGERPLPAGEFVLGYPNAYGTLPFSPSVPEGSVAPAVGQVLPPAQAAARAGTREAAQESTSAQRAAAAVRDLGRNGSYLVYRKLAQDVEGFWHFCNEAAGEDAADRSPEWVAAHMVGRWPSGAPLVLTPDSDDPDIAKAPDRLTDFLYARDDPDGLRCPLGAHVRRANPRDSLTGDREESRTISDKHRLVRRGRSYGSRHVIETAGGDTTAIPPDAEQRGLIFVALMANLARQFEFVQQTWMNNPKFHSLYDARDPISGDNDDGTPARDNLSLAIPCRYTIPQLPVRQRMEDVPRFVTVRAGAYFFLPGIAALAYLAGVPRPDRTANAAEATLT